MQKVIKNDWQREAGKSFVRARILDHEAHPEGLDVERVRFLEGGDFPLEPDSGHVLSILRGEGKLHLKGDGPQALHLEEGVHLYLPPGSEGVLKGKPETEFILVSSPSAYQARGRKLLLRNETFLSACASGGQLFRWVITPQYLSRRIFLHHDSTLLSRSGHPVSWFHTTMFDVAGLPGNEDGRPAFKMSYNSRTEVNFCYDVKGDACVRMAQHPYREKKQLWGPWLPLDGDSTYHLNEAAGGPEEEHYIDKVSQATRTFRNKHEVSITEGYVSLFCIFDPAPTGMECHRPGEYSDYDPLSQVVGTESFESYMRQIVHYDEMVDRLSMAKAMGKLDDFQGTPVWDVYLKGRDAQQTIETELMKKLVAQNNGREQVLTRWVQNARAREKDDGPRDHMRKA